MDQLRKAMTPDVHEDEHDPKDAARFARMEDLRYGETGKLQHPNEFDKPYVVGRFPLERPIVCPVGAASPIKEDK